MGISSKFPLALSLSKGLLLLAACSEGGTAPPPDPDSLVECALAGADAFARDCAVETAREGDGVVLTLRHPDGGFRRLAVAGDGSVASADGADRAVTAPRGDGYEVTVGSDRYRLPARFMDDGGR